MNIKKYYLRFINMTSTKNELNDMCLESGLDEKQLRLKMSSYNIKFGTRSEQEKYERVVASLREKSNGNKNQEYFPLIIKILRSSNKEEIINILAGSDVKDAKEFSQITTSYIINIGKNTKEEIVNTISNKLHSVSNLYEQYLNRELEQKRREAIEKKRIEKRNEIINKRIELANFLKDIGTSNYQTSKEYLEANDIDKAQYDYAVKSIEDKEKPSFIEYCTLMVEKMKDSKFGDKNLLSLIEKIVNGVDGRPFDLLDYYENTKLSLSEMSKLCNYGLDPENYRILKTFIGKDMSDEFFDIKKEREVKEKITINGIQIIPTAEDKQRAFNYLVEHNYPIDYKVYRIVLTRIILNFNKEKTLIK